MVSTRPSLFDALAAKVAATQGCCLGSSALALSPTSPLRSSAASIAARAARLKMQASSPSAGMKAPQETLRPESLLEDAANIMAYRLGREVLQRMKQDFGKFPQPLTLASGCSGTDVFSEAVELFLNAIGEVNLNKYTTKAPSNRRDS